MSKENNPLKTSDLFICFYISLKYQKYIIV